MNYVSEVYSKLSNWFLEFGKHQKTTLISSAMIGIICNLYVFTNRLPHFDDIYGIGVGGGPIWQGRWFLGILALLRYRSIGDYSEPVFNGVLTVCFIALAAGFVVDGLRIRGCGGVVAGALMQVFPVIACTYLFMNLVEYFALAILLSTLGAYLLLENTKPLGWGFVLQCGAASILIMCGLGIYQAYFPYTVSFVLMGIIVHGISDEANGKVLLKQMLSSLVSLMMAMIGYLITMRGVARLAGVSIHDWHGQTIGDIPILMIPTLIKKTYRYLYTFYRYGEWGLSNVRFIRVIAGILAIITVFWLVQHIVNRIKRGRVMEGFLLLLCSLVIPVAVNLIYLMVPDDTSGIGIHILMLYSVVLLFVFPLAISNQTAWAGICGRLVMVVSIISVVYYADFTNKIYVYFDYAINSAKTYYTVLVSEIKAVDGYDPGLSIAYIGDVDDESVFNLSSYFDVLQDISTLLHFAPGSGH